LIGTLRQLSANSQRSSFLYTVENVSCSSVLNFMAFNRGSSSFMTFGVDEQQRWAGTVFFHISKNTLISHLRTTTNNSQLLSIIIYIIRMQRLSRSRTDSIHSRMTSTGILHCRRLVFRRPLILMWNAIGVAHTTTSINPATKPDHRHTPLTMRLRNHARIFTSCQHYGESDSDSQECSTANAYGIKYTILQAYLLIAYASKEVIVAAGAVQTPNCSCCLALGLKRF